MSEIPKILDAYQTEIYEFLTQRENFENMLKVREKYDIVRKQLLDEFWDMVREKTELLLNDKNKWSVYLYDLDGDYPRCFISKKAWIKNDNEAIAVGWMRKKLKANPFFGVWLNEDTKELDFDKIRAHGKKLEALKGFDTTGEWWVGWKYGSVKLDEPDGLRQILPYTVIRLLMNLPIQSLILPATWRSI